MRCFFPGSFDPPTVGHLDLIERASRLFDEVVVGVMINPDKKGLFSPAERVELLKKCALHLPNVHVMADGGLTVDMARRVGANVILRGMRGEGDVALESQLAAANRHVSGMETLILFTAPKYGFVSSSIVRDLLRHGGSIEGMVPESIRDVILARQSNTSLPIGRSV